MGLCGFGRWCLLTVVGGVVVASASARAECFHGTRPSTSTERAFQVKTLTAIKAAMPEAPGGWRVIDETPIQSSSVACIGAERQPLTLEYLMRLRRIAPAVRGGGSADGGQDGDPGGEATILVEVNARDRTIQAPVDALAIDGIALAFRHTSGLASTIDLMLGDWSLERGGDGQSEQGAHAYLVSDLPYTKVQTLLIRIADDVPGGAEALVRDLKLNALKQLVFR